MASLRAAIDGAVRGIPALLARLGVVDRRMGEEAFRLATPVMVTGGLRSFLRLADFVIVGIASAASASPPAPPSAPRRRIDLLRGRRGVQSRFSRFGRGPPAWTDERVATVAPGRRRRAEVARAPPADDSAPDVIEFGIPVLDERLEEVELTFPAERADLEATIGPMEVPYDATGRTLRLDEALETLEADRFESRNELLEALHPVFEAHRAGSPAGFVDRLRALLPF